MPRQVTCRATTKNKEMTVAGANCPLPAYRGQQQQRRHAEVNRPAASGSPRPAAATTTLQADPRPARGDRRESLRAAASITPGRIHLEPAAATRAVSSLLSDGQRC
jgi:hypothetical protein